MIKTAYIALLFSASILLLTGRAGADDNLTVKFGQHTITASGLAPGSSAVFFGIAQVPIPHAYMNRVQRWAVIVDDARHDGTVTLDLKQDVPPTSVWAVVDLRNAHYATVSGPGVRLRETALDNPLRKGFSLAVDRFAFDHGYLELLYVHPGLGAWTMSGIGGTTANRDEPKGSTVVSLTDAKPVGSNISKPAAFVPGGILVAVDFTRLDVAVVRLDSAIIGGAR